VHVGCHGKILQIILLMLWNQNFI